MVFYATYKKSIRALHLMIIGCVFGILHIHAEVRSQLITLSVSNSPLSAVIKQIRNQSGYGFLYTDATLLGAQPISVSLHQVKFEDALEIIFKDQPISYSIDEKTVILERKDTQRTMHPVNSINGIQSSVQQSVHGLVSDVQGQPLLGVSVMIKGSARGTATDAQGAFELESVSIEDVLVLSLLGYRQLEIKVNQQEDVLRINMDLLPNNLDEIVVMGYSTKQISHLSSAVAVVSGEKLNDVTSNNVTNLLQGKVAGVIVSNSSGDPNAEASINIRGAGSINAGSGPLYVVDGIVGGTANASDVESVTVLKDAAATGLYGSRAANGVIIVTTKSGKSGKTKINLNSSLGFNRANTGNFKVMDAKQLYDYEKTFYPTDLFDKDIPATVLSQNTNWFNQAFGRGITQNHALSVSGGSEKTVFYMAGNYYYEEGTLQFNSNQQFNVRTNIKHAINDKLELTVKLNAKLSGHRSDPSGLDGALYGAYMNMPWDNPFDADGNIKKGTEGGWYGREQENFLHGWQYNLDKSSNKGMDMDAALKYTILPSLSISTFNRITYRAYENEIYHDVRSKAGKGLGRLSNSFDNGLSLITSNRLQYVKNFGMHNFDALAVLEAEKNQDKANQVTGEGIAPDLHVMSAASRILDASGGVDENIFTKGLFQLDYNYDNRYFLIGSFINEASSRFGRSNRSANFYTLGGAWILSNEAFLKENKHIDLLKLRLSYGITGNANIGNYQALGLYSYTTQYANNSGAFPFQMRNDELTWEKAASYNLGFDIALFNRITLNVDLYDKKTKGLLLNVEKPYTSGFATVIQNVGSIQNKGLEVNLSTENIRGKFNWQTNFNIAFNKNTVLELGNGKDIRQGNMLISTGGDMYTWNMRKWVGVDADNGDPLWEKITMNAQGKAEITHTSSYSDATQQNVGSASPNFTGGMSNTFTYGNLSLSAFFNFVQGNLIYHTSRALFDSDGAYNTYNSMVLADGWSRWEKPGDQATHPKPVFGGNNNSNQASSRFLEEGSYLRLRNLTFAYEFSERLMNQLHIAKARIYLSGDNLLTFTKFSGMDPEVVLGPSGGTSSIKYPISRKVLLGINVSF